MMAGTAVAAVAGVGLGLRGTDEAHIPRVAMVAAVFFIGSLVHVPAGVASVHLTLTGLAGLLLGWCAFPAVGAALLLQVVLFGFGGITSWGANVVNMALPGVLCHYLYARGVRRARNETSRFLLGAAAGVTGVLVSGLMLAGTLLLCGRAFRAAAAAILAGHVPVMIVEAVVTGSAVVFLHRVRPGMLDGAAGRAA
jgi:cobalt/nickel transport system permease protein